MKDAYGGSIPRSLLTLGACLELNHATSAAGQVEIIFLDEKERQIEAVDFGPTHGDETGRTLAIPQKVAERSSKIPIRLRFRLYDANSLAVVIPPWTFSSI